MEYEGLKNVICLGDLKQAALYFDRVLPVSVQHIRGARFVEEKTKEDLVFFLPDPVAGEDLLYLITGQEISSEIAKWSGIWDFVTAWSSFTRNINEVRKGLNDDYSDVTPHYLNNTALPNGGTIRDQFSLLSKQFGFQDSSCLLAGDVGSPSSWHCPTFSLIDLDLVDTTQATWEQIWDFRADEESQRKLRRLRLFLYTNYDDKPKSYIEDDICQRLDDYETARKKFGFETKTSILSGLLDAKNIQTSAATAIAATFLGGPWLGLTVPVIIEIGKLTLEFAKRRTAIKDFEKSHDFAYVIQARSMLSE